MPCFELGDVGSIPARPAHVSVTQWIRVLRYERRSREFESLRRHQLVLIFQFQILRLRTNFHLVCTEFCYVDTIMCMDFLVRILSSSIYKYPVSSGVEQRLDKAWVGGSRPPLGTKIWDRSSVGRAADF